MAMTFARAFITGRATKDVQVRTINGKNGEFPVANMALAVDRAWNLPKPEGADKATDFFNIELSGPQATYAQYVKQGDLVCVEVALYQGKPYTDKNGTVHQDLACRAEEIYIIGKPMPKNPENQNGQPPQNGGYQNQPRPQNGGYQPPQNGGYYQPPQNGGYQPPQNGGYQPPQNGGYQPPQNGGYQPPQNGGYQPPQNGGYQPPQNGYGQPPVNNDGNFGMNPPDGFSPMPDGVNDPFGMGG